MISVVYQKPYSSLHTIITTLVFMPSAARFEMHLMPTSPFHCIQLQFIFQG